jgi:carboxypeptidase C (cathepsin A)
MNYDPQAAAISAAFTASFLDYYHNDLGFGRDMEYKVSGEVFRDWDWSHRSPDGGFFPLPFPNTSIDLARAMGLSPAMKLLVQQGYYDLATPQLATEYYIDHMDLLPEQRENVSIEYYEAGHMMYLHEPSLVKFGKDLAGFIRSATGSD